MKPFTGKLSLVAAVFLPMIVFCLALSPQWLREGHKKKEYCKENQWIVTEKTEALACLSEKAEPASYLLFEQLIR